MIDNCVVHWLYTTVSPELLDVIMQPEDTALTVWTALQELFRDNQLARAVYIDAEYHALVQGDMTVMQYCAKLKSFTDQLRNLGQPVTEVQQVFNLLRGLGRQFHHAIPHITSRVPLPSFLQVRSFLMLEEHRAEQSARQNAAHALLAGRAPAPAPAYGGDGSSSSGGGRNRGRNRNKGKGKAPADPPPAPPASASSPAPRPPTYPAPAPGTNSWTGLVQAWPVHWRAPGAGVLGPRPGTPHQQALMAVAPSQLPYQYGPGIAPPQLPYNYGGLPPYGYTYGSPGAGPSTPAPPNFGTPGASSSTAPASPQPWDMGALQAALHGTTSSPSGGTSDWYLDTGASSHMSSGAGPSNSDGDSAL
nr:uncharacterized protein LOC127348758 [Lolium perenne]